MLILLSGSLSGLRLLPGIPLPGIDTVQDSTISQLPDASLETRPFSIIQGFLATLFFVIVIYMSIQLIKVIPLKELLLPVLVLVILVLAIILLSRVPVNRLPSESAPYTRIAPPASEIYSVAPPVEQLTEIIWLVCILLILGLCVPFLLMIRKGLNSDDVINPILQEAKTAAAAIQNGADFADVILRCYFEMANSIQKEHGIARESNLTVREFEEQLEKHGFPSPPFRNLTMLFEKARYSVETISGKDEELALECLNDIIRCCQEGSKLTNESA